jgi:transcriptional regulator with XRE-family HTH domain
MAPKPNLRLQTARRNAGLTQAQLSAQTSLSQRLISSLETGEREGSVETYTRLSKVLGVSVSYLLGERAQPQAEMPSRVEILHDPGTPPELLRLARNAVLCEELAIQPEEWAFLRQLQSPAILTRDAYIAILHIARGCAAT